MNIRLIRHATLQLEFNGKHFLIDPMLSSVGEMEPTPNPKNQSRNPLVELPCELPKFDQFDAVIVTHTHRDHFDLTAAKTIPKHLPLFCQPEDEKTFINLGFTQVFPIVVSSIWNGIEISRTKGRHGRGEMEQKMGPVSGFVFKTEQEPVLYITGDTVWCPEIEQVLTRFYPDVTIAFAGAAQFPTGGPITMSAEDIEQVCKTHPKTKVIAVHMESWNHCMLTRKELQDYAKNHQFSHQVLIPKDGEWLGFK